MPCARQLSACHDIPTRFLQALGTGLESPSRTTTLAPHLQCHAVVVMVQVALGGLLPTLLVATSELKMCREYREHCQQLHRPGGNSTDSSGCIQPTTWLGRGAELLSKLAPQPDARFEATSMEWVAALAAACCLYGVLWEVIVAFVAR